MFGTTGKLAAVARKRITSCFPVQNVALAAIDGIKARLLGNVLTVPDFLYNRQTVRYYGYPYYANWMMLRDIKRRKLMEKHYDDRMRLNAIRRTKTLPIELIEAATTDLLSQPRDASYVRKHDRCFVSSRPRACYHQWRMARMVFRCEADANRLSGTSRADWFNCNDKRYNANLQPDLRNTLNAIQPITYEVHQHLYSRTYYGKFMLPPRYNQSIFKTKSFQYPPVREGDSVPALYTHVCKGIRSRKEQVRREEYLTTHGMGGRPRLKVRTALCWRPRPNLRFKRESWTLTTVDREHIPDVTVPEAGVRPLGA